jgi:hypothetical protein
VRSFDPGTREDGMQWCLGGHFLRQEVSVKIQYAQKLSKLSGGLGGGKACICTTCASGDREPLSEMLPR